MENYFKIDRFFERIPQILPYLGTTFSMVFISMLLGTILAVLVAFLRIRKIPVIHQLLSVYISFMRGTPLLVQMCIAYYGLPILFHDLFYGVFGINLNRMDAIYFVEIAFILNEGAFLGEIFRSTILAVPQVQMDAGYSIGMTYWQVMIRIILPQAFKVAIPHYGVDMIGVFHNTSLAFTLGVMEIMGRAKALGVATSHSIESFAVVAVIYIFISLVIKGVFKIIESKMNYVKGGNHGI